MYILLRSDSNFNYYNFRLRIIFYILFSHSAKSPMDIIECCDIYSTVIYFECRLPRCVYRNNR